ncbi:uncharacterized protein V1518DRAFT_424914 [Limtongia smithiae]|uniref:uncharacterized protein n=1 Tax=Limtongia smithiae TaxID=1125753 RepID=UPI0034CE9CA8
MDDNEIENMQQTNTPSSLLTNENAEYAEDGEFVAPVILPLLEKKKKKKKKKKRILAVSDSALLSLSTLIPLTGSPIMPFHCASSSTPPLYRMSLRCPVLIYWSDDF